MIEFTTMFSNGLNLLCEMFTDVSPERHSRALIKGMRRERRYQMSERYKKCVNLRLRCMKQAKKIRELIDGFNHDERNMLLRAYNTSKITGMSLGLLFDISELNEAKRGSK